MSGRGDKVEVMSEEKKITNFTTPILIALLAIAAFLAGAFFTKIQYLEKGKPGTAQVTPTPQAAVQPSPAVLGTTVGNFSVTKEEVCLEDGKPIIYFFGRSTCPHCSWEHPIMERVATKFGNKIAFHNNMDNQVDMEIFSKYSEINQGGIPFLVFGCKYARVGSGENWGETEEEKALTALICKLTDGEPEKTCEGVSDLIEQIE